MPADQLLALVTLAVVGSFTPGPNNAIAAVTGANHGVRAAMPHVVGVPLGFGTMLVAGGLGVAALLLAQPWLAQAIKWIGVGYLLWIAWRIASAPSAAASSSSASSERSVPKPLTVWQSAVFQYANPKAWMLAAATTGTFMAADATAVRTTLIVAVFGATAAASLLLWAWTGAALRGWLAVGRRLDAFNRAMGTLLAATALWMALT